MSSSESRLRSWPLAVALAGLVVLCLAWCAGKRVPYWIGVFLVWLRLMWGWNQVWYARHRMRLRRQIPESTRLESLAYPRYEVVLESGGEDSRKTAKALRKLYVIASRETRELLAGTPVVLKSSVWHAEAELVKSRLEAAGAVVRLEQESQV